jgi:nucleoporin NDC1
VCASLSEDRYGNVQRDIPKILEALLSFLTAIEDYQMELMKKYSPSHSDQPSPKELEERELMRVELDKATDVLAYVGDGASRSINSTPLLFISLIVYFF